MEQKDGSRDVAGRGAGIKDVPSVSGKDSRYRRRQHAIAYSSLG